MDFFKGIGNFFGGLFGGKKKKEEQPQPQNNSAVQFKNNPTNRPQGFKFGGLNFGNIGMGNQSRPNLGQINQPINQPKPSIQPKPNQVQKEPTILERVANLGNTINKTVGEMSKPLNQQAEQTKPSLPTQGLQTKPTTQPTLNLGNTANQNNIGRQNIGLGYKQNANLGQISKPTTNPTNTLQMLNNGFGALRNNISNLQAEARKRQQQEKQNQLNQAISRANSEISKGGVKDKYGYYGSEIDALRAEINKGANANIQKINGLRQSAENRRNELNTNNLTGLNRYKQNKLDSLTNSYYNQERKKLDTATGFSGWTDNLFNGGKKDELARSQARVRATSEFMDKYGYDDQDILKKNLAVADKQRRDINKPSFVDYLNPIGENGLFGRKQIMNYRNNVQKPISETMEKVNKWIDSTDNKEGFQANDVGDYFRFLGKLAPGMVQGVVEAPEKIVSGLTGQRIDEKGKAKGISTTQQIGDVLDGFISTAGLFFGGSGTAMKAVTTGAKQASKQGAKQAIKTLAKESAKEGLEEGVQTFAQDLSDDGKVNTKLEDYLKAVGTGAAAGGALHTLGKGIEYGKRGAVNMFNGIKNPYTNTNIVPRTPITPNAGNRKNLNRLIEQSLIDGRTPKDLNYLGRIDKTRFNKANQLQGNAGNPQLANRNIYAPENNFVEHIQKRFAENPSKENIQKLQDSTYNALFGKGGDVLRSKNPYNVLFVNKNDPTGAAVLGNNTSTNNTELRSTIPMRKRSIEKLETSQMKSPEGNPSGANTTIPQNKPNGNTFHNIADPNKNRAVQHKDYLNKVSGVNTKIADQMPVNISRLQPSQMGFNKDAILGAVYGDTRSRMAKRGFNNLQRARVNNPYTTSDGIGVNLSARGNKKITSIGAKVPENMFNAKMRTTAKIDEIISKAQKSHNAPDYKNHGIAKDGFNYFNTPVRVSGKNYNLGLDVAKNGEVNTLYNTKITPDTAGFLPPAKPSGVNTNTLPQNKPNSNIDQTDNTKFSFSEDANNTNTNTNINNTKQEFHSRDELVKRHFNISGDEALAFKTWQDIRDKKVEGWYDQATDSIGIDPSNLSMQTLNHELGHKMLERIPRESKADILNEIIESKGLDNLQKEYGSRYGNNPLDLAEEALSDGYAKYVKAIQEGKDISIFGKTFNIPPRVIALYDRIYQAISSLIGKQDRIKQFYSQIETGKFKNKPQVESPRSAEAFKIRETPNGKYVEIDKNILNNLSNKNGYSISKAIKEYFSKNLQGNAYVLNYGKDGEAFISRKSKNKYSNPNQSLNDLMIKGQIAGEIPDILKISEFIGRANDTKSHNFARNGFEYRRATVKVGEDMYNLRLNVGISEKGKLLYDINGIEKLPELLKGASNGESSIGTIPHNNPEVKYMLGGKNAKGWDDAVEKGRNFTGIDNIDRFEFDDSKANIKEDFWSIYDRVRQTGRRRAYRLSDIFEHEELFKNYPDLKDMPVEFYRNKPKGNKITLGEYIPNKDKLQINAYLAKDPEKTKGTILHEIQHALQKREGFQNGYKRDLTAEYKDFDTIRKEYNQEYYDFKAKEDSYSPEERQRELDRLLGLRRQVDAKLNSIKRENIRRNRDYDEYIHTAEEFESRTVSNRMNMTQAERDANPFYQDTEKLHKPLDEVLVRGERYGNMEQVHSNPNGVSDTTQKSTPELEPEHIQENTPENINQSTPKEQASPVLENPTERLNNIQDFDPSRYAKEQEKLADEARKAERLSIKDRASNAKEDFMTAWVDDMYAIEGKLKNETDRFNMREAIDRTRRADILADSFMQDNGLQKLIHSLNSKDLREFDQYLIARRAVELDNQGIETGRNIAMDKQYIEVMEKDGRFEQHRQVVREYSNKMLEASVNYGLIEPELAKSLKQNYPDYVPFDRIFSEEEVSTKRKGKSRAIASLSSQDIVQRIKGSNRKIGSPLNALLEKTQDLVEQGERNTTAKLLASYKNLKGNPFELRELKAGEAVDGRPSISYFENGKKVTLLTTKEIADAAKNLERPQLGVLAHIIQTPTRILKAGATGVNAGFALANTLKDFIGASINSKNGKSVFNPKTAVKSLQAAFNHKGQAYMELAREGVTGNSYDVFRNKKNISLKDVRNRKGWRSVVDKIKHPLRTYENVIGRSEDFGRAMQYYSNKSAAMRKGMSEAQAKRFAADQARYNSTNFMRWGKHGKWMNAVVPYSNANIQGQRILLRRFKEAPVKYTTKTFLGIAAPIAVIAAYNTYSEDEDMKKVLERTPDYVKKNNIIVRMPGQKPHIDTATGEITGVMMIPVPPQYVPLNDEIQNLVKGDVDFKRIAGNASEQITTFDLTDPTSIASKYTPQGIKPVVEAISNKNLFTGKKIVADSMQHWKPEDQYDNSTSLTAKTIGKMLGWSPKHIDNFIRTTTGGAGQNAVNLSDTMIAKATPEDDDEQIKGKTVADSIRGRFELTRGISDSQLYHDSLDEAMKKNKLGVRDLEVLQAVLAKRYEDTGNGMEMVAKNEAEKLANNKLLSSSPEAAKTWMDAQKMLAKKKGLDPIKDVDPLYNLPLEKQLKFYQIKGEAKDSIEQRHMENKEADWLKPLKAERSEYFKKIYKDKPRDSEDGYPNASPALQDKLNNYYKMQGQEKYRYLAENKDIGEHFNKVNEYNRKIRAEQGYDPLKQRPVASEYVQAQMDAKNWNDPQVKKYMNDKSMYDIAHNAGLADFEGEEFSQKDLKAISSMGRFGIVKNPDGTYRLAQAGEKVYNGRAGGSGRGRRGGRRGRSSGGGSGSSESAGNLFNNLKSIREAARSGGDKIYNAGARNSSVQLNSMQFRGKSEDFSNFTKRLRRNKVSVKKSKAVRFM